MTCGHSEHNKMGGRVVVGGLLALVGGYYLIENIYLEPNGIQLHVWDNIFSWSTLVFFIGAVVAASNENKIVGIVMMLIGGVSFSANYIDGVDPLDLLLPLLLLSVGALILFNRGDKRKEEHLGGLPKGGEIDMRVKSDKKGCFGEPRQESSDYINVTNVFSGGSRVYHTQNFRGGEITCVFGGAEINLTQCKLAPGVNYLDVTFVLGGVEMYIPRNWNVVMDVTPVLGGFSIEGFSTPEDMDDPENKLVIRGTCVLGGGEIKRM
jgi:predicted membrane protein